MTDSTDDVNWYDGDEEDNDPTTEQLLSELNDAFYRFKYGTDIKIKSLENRIKMLEFKIESMEKIK